MVEKSEGEILRQKAEELLKEKITGAGSKRSEVDILKLIHELEVHQIELELQNEELMQAKTAQKELSDKYIELYDFAPSGYFTLSKDGEIIELNFSGAKMLGYNRSKLKNRLFVNFVVNDARPIFDLFLRSVFENNEEESCELRLSTNGNQSMIVLLRGIVNAAQGLCLVNVVDITELRNSAMALQISEAKYHGLFEQFRSIAENVSIGFIITRKCDSKIVFANAAIHEMLEFKPGGLVDTYARDFYFNPEDREEALLILQKQGYLRAYELRFKKFDGSPIWVSTTVQHTEFNNEPVMMGTAIDITDRKRAEEALKESQSRLNLALENGNIGIWEMDLSNKRLDLDLRMAIMLGLKKEVKEGTFEDFEKLLVEEDIPHLREAIRRSIEENVPFQTIYRIMPANGEIHYLNSKGLVTCDESGKAIRLSGVCFDITEMKKGTEQALFKLNDELLRSNKELEQFAYIASHDLQEPLRTVTTFTKLLAQRFENDLDERTHQFIKFVIEAAERSRELINDLLIYSRIGSGVLKFSIVDFNQVIEIILKNLADKMEDKKAVVTYDELPLIYSDREQMIQLFQNLLVNSLKFCDTVPRVHISAKEQPNSYLFSVKDNGTGIDQQYSDRIFMIFQRLVSRHEYEGSGIGLAVCKRIVERHDGKIWIESKIGEGTTFYFTIAKTTEAN